MIRNPSDQIKALAQHIFAEEIADLEKDGYLIIYRDIFIEGDKYVLDLDVVKNQILYPGRIRRPLSYP